MAIEDKLSYIYNKIIFLLPQLKNINVAKLNLLPSQITKMTIGENKISECTDGSIQTVTENDLNSVTEIGSYAFTNCTSLTDITIPNSVTTIGESAFSNTGYSNNASNWEGGLLYIDNYLVQAKHNNFSSCEIKQGTKVIADYCFGYNDILTSITIPSTVIKISDYMCCDCTSLTSITIPDSVTSIGNGAFYGCDSLTSITIPDSVTSIDYNAFLSCTRLADIYLNPTTPPSLSSTSAIPDHTTIHVPVGSGDAYKSATNWSYHSSRIVEDIEI